MNALPHKGWGKQPIKRAKPPSHSEVLRVEAEEIAEKHRQLKRDFYRRREERERKARDAL